MHYTTLVFASKCRRSSIIPTGGPHLRPLERVALWRSQIELLPLGFGAMNKFAPLLLQPQVGPVLTPTAAFCSPSGLHFPQNVGSFRSFPFAKEGAALSTSTTFSTLILEAPAVKLDEATSSTSTLFSTLFEAKGDTSDGEAVGGGDDDDPYIFKAPDAKGATSDGKAVSGGDDKDTYAAATLDWLMVLLWFVRQHGSFTALLAGGLACGVASVCGVWYQATSSTSSLFSTLFGVDTFDGEASFLAFGFLLTICLLWQCCDFDLLWRCALTCSRKWCEHDHIQRCVLRLVRQLCVRLVRQGSFAALLAGGLACGVASVCGVWCCVEWTLAHRPVDAALWRDVLLMAVLVTTLFAYLFTNMTRRVRNTCLCVAIGFAVLVTSKVYATTVQSFLDQVYAPQVYATTVLPAVQSLQSRYEYYSTEAIEAIGTNPNLKVRLLI